MTTTNYIINFMSTIDRAMTEKIEKDSEDRKMGMIVLICIFVFILFLILCDYIRSLLFPERRRATVQMCMG